MPSTKHKPASYDETAVLAAAAAARSAGLSWRQVEAQLLSAGVKVSHVTLRTKLKRISVVPASQPISRGALVKSLGPLVSERRAAGLTIREVAAELTAAGLLISTDSLRTYLSKTKVTTVEKGVNSERGRHE